MTNTADSTLYSIKVNIEAVKNRTLKATVRDHTLIIDQPEEFGADNQGPTPPELLAVAFGSCIASTIQLIAAQRNIDVTNIKVKVEGTVDFAKALGISDAKRAGLEGLDALISFDAPLSKEEKQQIIDQVAAVGAALDNIENPTPLTYTLI